MCTDYAYALYHCHILLWFVHPTVVEVALYIYPRPSWDSIRDIDSIFMKTLHVM